VRCASLTCSDNPFIAALPRELEFDGRGHSPAIFKKFMAYCRARRDLKMEVISAVWSILPMPIAEEIESHITDIAVPNEKKRDSDTVVDPKKRRTNK
jgi:hypothetical protein